MKCKKCKQEKENTEYYKHPSWKSGYHSTCKECMNNVKVFNVKKCNYCNTTYECKEYKYSKIKSKKCNKCTNKQVKQYLSNRKKIKPIYKTKKCNKCNIIKNNKKFGKCKMYTDNIHVTCKECRRPKLTFSKRHCTKCNQSYDCKPYKSRTKRKKYCNSCVRKNNNEYRRKYISKNKPVTALRNIIGQSFIRALNGSYKKSERTEYLLGCTIKEAITYIESTFKEGMSWENHGKCGNGINCNDVWHIDHKIPLNSTETEEDLIKLCHYTNLQALWATDNIRKNNKIY